LIQQHESTELQPKHHTLYNPRGSETSSQHHRGYLFLASVPEVGDLLDLLQGTAPGLDLRRHVSQVRGLHHPRYTDLTVLQTQKQLIDGMVAFTTVFNSYFVILWQSVYLTSTSYLVVSLK